MSNVLSQEKKQQVIALGRLGWTLRKIEQTTGVRRETASRYLKEAGVAIRPPRGWGRGTPAPSSRAPDSKPANEDQVITDFGGALEALRPSGRSPTASTCETYREAVELGLSRDRNAMAIYQDLVDSCGFPGSYQSVQRFVRKLRGASTPEARAVIETAPGEEAQVDYGSGPMVRDPESATYRRTRLFVLTLGYSRKAVRLLVWRSSAQTWAELHEKAFRRLGGTTRLVVLDNLREGVLEPDIYDPAINPLFRDVLQHYGVVALPCRVRDPDRKGKVESAVGHAKKTPLKGLRFESLADAQAYLDHWEERWADTRIHGTTKRQVSAMFAEERPALLPLPVEPFRYYKYGERTVHLDGCVEVEAAYYSAPPGWVGQRVRVQWDGTFVRLLDPRSGQLLREHLRAKRGVHRIPPEDQPPRTRPGMQQLLWRAENTGPQIGVLCRQMHRRNSITAVRRIQGVLALTKKYGQAAVEQACGVALEVGFADYRLVRRYLERTPPVTLRQVDPLIRQLTLYRDFIENQTKDQQL
ncbi:MAG TPA: IS21 family transposase [Candidatus Acidoferrum sp.]|nr:IS21 family transposase [Candidatus Acidoferrum sp.]